MMIDWDSYLIGFVTAGVIAMFLTLITWGGTNGK